MTGERKRSIAVEEPSVEATETPGTIHDEMLETSLVPSPVSVRVMAVSRAVIAFLTESAT
jgi:hypothetical protein